MPEKKIGSRTFRTKKLDAVEATRYLIRLTKTLGPGLNQIIAAFTSSDKEASDGPVVEALVAIVSANDEEHFIQLLSDLISLAEIEIPGQGYEQCRFEMHFSDNPLEAFAVAGFVARENFAGFFSGALASALKRSPPVKA